MVGNTAQYVSIVKTVVEWPSLSLITFSDSPISSKAVACVCRLCRARHKRHYAETKVMPMGFSAGERTGLSLGRSRHNQSPFRNASRSLSARYRPGKAFNGRVLLRIFSFKTKSADRYTCVVSTDS